MRETWMRLSRKRCYVTATGIEFNQASDTRWGGAVGTGIEIGFAPNWSAAVEYDHLFMGQPQCCFPGIGPLRSRAATISVRTWTSEPSG
jgi:outer membrane immunogenic protein